jgi:putative ATP-binding cassette transporter
MRLVYLLFRASWPTVVAAIFIGLISGVASIALIRMIRLPLRGRHEMPGLEAAFGFIGLCAVVVGTRVVVQVLLTRLSQRSMSSLTRDMTRQLLSVPLRRFEDLGGHKFVSALTHDVQTISGAMNKLAIICVNAILLMCGMAYLGWLSPQLLLGLVIFILAGGVALRLFAKPTRRYVKATRAAQMGLFKLLRDMVTGVKELKLHRKRREAYMDDAVSTADGQLREAARAGAKYQAVFNSGSRFLAFLAIGLMLFVWPRFHPLGPEEKFAILITMFFMMGPLDQVFMLLPTIIKTRVSVRRLQKLGLLLNEESEVIPPRESPLPTDWRQIELTGIQLVYAHDEADEDDADDGPTPDADDDMIAASTVDRDAKLDSEPKIDEPGFTLGPIDLTVRRGESLFIVGGNGSGKTTLVKLLTGLYKADAGRIQVDDRLIGPAEQDDYRQLFSVVFADVVIFEHLYGVDFTAMADKVNEYLHTLHLGRDVRIVNGSFSTTTALSRGQRKRLALLAAYLEDRPVYVFDEWAADQDPMFKRVFYHKILPDLKSQNKAIVCVTHDDNYFHTADRLVTLRDGKVIEGYSEENLIQRESRLEPAV